jgi:hypothetical protein
VHCHSVVGHGVATGTGRRLNADQGG